MRLAGQVNHNLTTTRQDSNEMVSTLKPRRFSRAKERAAKRYSSDLSEPEWQVIRPLVPPQSTGRGRKRQVDEREILNATF